MPDLPPDRPPTESRPLPPLDRWFWLAALLIAMVVIPRSAMISWSHSGYIDDDWHIRRGLLFVTKNLSGQPVNLDNPPFGDGLMVLPLVALGCTPDEPLNPATMPPGWANTPPANPKLAHNSLVYRGHVIFGRQLQPNVILLIIAIWKSILWIPCAVLIFHWCRALYGLSSAWLVTAMLLVDPTIAAHLPPAAVDSISAEAFVFMGFCAWRYLDSPRYWKLALTALSTAAVMLIKNTGLIAPFIVLLLAVSHWYIRPLLRGVRWTELRPTLRVRFNTVLLAGLLLVFFIWALLGFDVSIPRNTAWSTSFADKDSIVARYLDPLLDFRRPAGIYIGSIVGAIQHSRIGHWGFLLGQHRIGGWWYYFPVVSTFKIPIGFGLVFLAGLWSLRRFRPRWDEIFLLLPMLIWLGLLFASPLNIGFRHMIPAYVLMMMLASRGIARTGRVVRIVLWIAVAASGVHALSYHPDYLSYVNFPRHKPYLSINDSNIDWGQSLKQVAQWLDEHPHPGRPAYLGYFFDVPTPKMWFYVGDRAIPLERSAPPPTHGILIISPVWEAGMYFLQDTYAQLRSMEPDAVIGHCMLVYDLDKHAPPGKPFVWQPPPYRMIPGWHGPYPPPPSTQPADSTPPTSDEP